MSSGYGGVFRSLDNGQTWTVFPNTAFDSAPVDGGYLPSVEVTSLALNLGDISPATGHATQVVGDPEVLLATTFGRGDFAIRLAPDIFPTTIDARPGQRLRHALRQPPAHQQPARRSSTASARSPTTGIWSTVDLIDETPGTAGFGTILGSVDHQRLRPVHRPGRLVRRRRPELPDPGRPGGEGPRVLHRREQGRRLPGHRQLGGQGEHHHIRLRDQAHPAAPPGHARPTRLPASVAAGSSSRPRPRSQVRLHQRHLAGLRDVTTTEPSTTTVELERSTSRSAFPTAGTTVVAIDARRHRATVDLTDTNLASPGQARPDRPDLLLPGGPGRPGGQPGHGRRPPRAGTSRSSSTTSRRPSRPRSRSTRSPTSGTGGGSNTSPYITKDAQPDLRRHRPCPATSSPWSGRSAAPTTPPSATRPTRPGRPARPRSRTTSGSRRRGRRVVLLPGRPDRHRAERQLPRHTPPPGLIVQVNRTPPATPTIAIPSSRRLGRPGQPADHQRPDAALHRDSLPLGSNTAGLTITITATYLVNGSYVAYSGGNALATTTVTSSLTYETPGHGVLAGRDSYRFFATITDKAGNLPRAPADPPDQGRGRTPCRSPRRWRSCRPTTPGSRGTASPPSSDQPAFIGTTDPGDTVKLYSVNANGVYSFVAQGTSSTVNGSFSFTLPNALTDGNAQLVAQTSDAAGNNRARIQRSSTSGSSPSPATTPTPGPPSSPSSSRPPRTGPTTRRPTPSRASDRSRPTAPPAATSRSSTTSTATARPTASPIATTPPTYYGFESTQGPETNLPAFGLGGISPAGLGRLLGQRDEHPGRATGRRPRPGTSPCPPAASRSSSAWTGGRHPRPGGLQRQRPDRDRRLPADPDQLDGPGRRPVLGLRGGDRDHRGLLLLPSRSRRSPGSPTRPATSPPRPTTTASATTSSPSTGRAPGRSSS